MKVPLLSWISVLATIPSFTFGQTPEMRIYIANSCGFRVSITNDTDMPVTIPGYHMANDNNLMMRPFLDQESSIHSVGPSVDFVEFPSNDILPPHGSRTYTIPFANIQYCWENQTSKEFFWVLGTQKSSIVIVENIEITENPFSTFTYSQSTNILRRLSFVFNSGHSQDVGLIILNGSRNEYYCEDSPQFTNRIDIVSKDNAILGQLDLAHEFGRNIYIQPNSGIEKRIPLLKILQSITLECQEVIAREHFCSLVWTHDNFVSELPLWIDVFPTEADFGDFKPDSAKDSLQGEDMRSNSINESVER